MKAMNDADLYIMVQNAHMRDRFIIIGARRQNIIELALHLKDEEIQSAVYLVSLLLNQHIKVLSLSIKNGNFRRHAARKHREKLESAAEKIIKVAAKIKTRDIA